MNVRNIAMLGGQVMAIVATVRSLRRAQKEGDNLRMLDAIVNALAVATTIAILVREIRERRGTEGLLDEDIK